MFNLVNVYMGIGLLSMPYAMRLSGWFGLIALAVAAAVFCASGKLIVKSFERLPDGPKSYARLGELHRLALHLSSGPRFYRIIGKYLSYCSLILRTHRVIVVVLNFAGFAALGTPGKSMVLFFATLEFFGALCMALVVIYKQIESFVPGDGEWNLRPFLLSGGRSNLRCHAYVNGPASMIICFHSKLYMM